MLQYYISDTDTAMLGLGESNYCKKGDTLAELLLPILFGGLLGYATGVSELRGFEELVRNARERINHLAYFKVVPPLAMFQTCNVPSAFYREAV